MLNFCVITFDESEIIFYLIPFEDNLCYGYLAVLTLTFFSNRQGEIGPLTFVRRLGIPKRIGISQFGFQNVQWR